MFVDEKMDNQTHQRDAVLKGQAGYITYTTNFHMQLINRYIMLIPKVVFFLSPLPR